MEGVTRIQKGGQTNKTQTMWRKDWCTHGSGKRTLEASSEEKIL